MFLALTIHSVERLDWIGYICQIHYIHIPITILQESMKHTLFELLFKAMKNNWNIMTEMEYALKHLKCPENIIFSENLTIFMTFLGKKS